MATHASAEKAARQALKRNAENRSTQSQYRNAIKTLRTAMKAKYDTKDAAKKALAPLLNRAQAVLMRAASKNVIKRGTASRQVARLSQAIDRVTA